MASYIAVMRHCVTSVFACIRHWQKKQCAGGELIKITSAVNANCALIKGINHTHVKFSQVTLGCASTEGRFMCGSS